MQEEKEDEEAGEGEGAKGIHDIFSISIAMLLHIQSQLVQENVPR